MNRLSLDVSALQVETFGTGLAAFSSAVGAETYPDCPTATGCTCVDACQSAVGACPETATLAQGVA
jgi:hypothetical protein